MKKDQELIVITKTYDLILWSCNHTSKFPRNHRFVLGERIERNLYNLLETLIQARYTKNRQRLLEAGQPHAGDPAVPDAIGQGPAMLEGPELRLRRQGHRRDRTIGGRLAPQPSRGDRSMKRYGYLWDGMISFENLLGPRRRPGGESGFVPRRPGSSSTWSGS